MLCAKEGECKRNVPAHIPIISLVNRATDSPNQPPFMNSHVVYIYYRLFPDGATSDLAVLMVRWPYTRRCTSSPPPYASTSMRRAQRPKSRCAPCSPVPYPHSHWFSPEGRASNRDRESAAYLPFSYLSHIASSSSTDLINASILIVIEDLYKRRRHRFFRSGRDLGAEWHPRHFFPNRTATWWRGDSNMGR